MGKHYLNPLFAPKSVAIFGTSDRPDSVGQIVFQNMLQSGFQGKLYPINPKSPQVQGRRAYAGIGEIWEPLELAVADNIQGKGLGHKLMVALMEAARDRDLSVIEGKVLSSNHKMLRLMTRLGYAIKVSEEDPSVMNVSKPL